MVCKTYLRRTQAEPSSRVKEQQEGISPNHVRAIFSASVGFSVLRATWCDGLVWECRLRNTSGRGAHVDPLANALYLDSPSPSARSWCSDFSGATQPSTTRHTTFVGTQDSVVAWLSRLLVVDCWYLIILQGKFGVGIHEIVSVNWIYKIHRPFIT